MNHLSQSHWWSFFFYLLPNVFKLFNSFRYFFQTSIYFTWRRRERIRENHVEININMPKNKQGRLERADYLLLKSEHTSQKDNTQASNYRALTKCVDILLKHMYSKKLHNVCKPEVTHEARILCTQTFSANKSRTRRPSWKQSSCWRMCLTPVSESYRTTWKHSSQKRHVRLEMLKLQASKQTRERQEDRQIQTVVIADLSQIYVSPRHVTQISCSLLNVNRKELICLLWPGSHHH